jgi:hypothetical protein
MASPREPRTAVAPKDSLANPVVHFWPDIKWRIPFWWRLIDSSFGLLGFIPVYFCSRWAKELESHSPRPDDS